MLIRYRSLSSAWCAELTFILLLCFSVCGAPASQTKKHDTLQKDVVYCAQVRSTRTRGKALNYARKWAKLLAEKKVLVADKNIYHILSGQVGAKVWYKVCLGSFLTREAASSFAQKVTRNGGELGFTKGDKGPRFFILNVNANPNKGHLLEPPPLAHSAMGQDFKAEHDTPQHFTSHSHDDRTKNPEGKGSKPEVLDRLSREIVKGWRNHEMPMLQSKFGSENLRWLGALRDILGPLEDPQGWSWNASVLIARLDAPTQNAKAAWPTALLILLEWFESLEGRDLEASFELRRLQESLIRIAPKVYLDYQLDYDKRQ